MPTRKFAALILLCAVVGIAGPFIVVKYVLKPSSQAVADKSAVTETPVSGKPTTTAPAISAHLDTLVSDTPVASQPVFNPAFPVTGVTMTGWVRRGRRILVTLSDGTTLNENHVALQEVNGASFAVIAGRVVPMKPRDRAPAAPAPAPVAAPVKPSAPEPQPSPPT